MPGIPDEIGGLLKQIEHGARYLGATWKLQKKLDLMEVQQLELWCEAIKREHARLFPTAPGAAPDA